MEKMALNADASLYRKQLLSLAQPFTPVLNGVKLKAIAS
jgi:hypothetical protein